MTPFNIGSIISVLRDWRQDTAEPHSTFFAQSQGKRQPHGPRGASVRAHQQASFWAPLSTPSEHLRQLGQLPQPQRSPHTAMLTFIPPTVPLRPARHSARTTRRARPPRPTTKRLRMSGADRATEFSLNDPEEPSSRVPPLSDPPLDWHDWYLTGRTMTIPAIPFPPLEVFLPGEKKTLHLFEARYLALFEHVVVHCDKRCAHVLIDAKRQAMAAHGAILHIRSWRRLDLGVSVEFEAVGRLKTSKMRNAAPFLRGDFEPVDDLEMTSEGRLQNIQKLEKRFWPAFREVVSLSIKLGKDPVREKVDTAAATIAALDGQDPQEGTKQQSLAGTNSLFVLSPEAKQQLFEQNLKQAARRAVNFEKLDFGTDVSDEMVIRRAVALSFAGWDFFPSHHSLRQRAIEERDTIVRLSNVVNGLEQQTKKLAAKLAVENAFL